MMHYSSLLHLVSAMTLACISATTAYVVTPSLRHQSCSSVPRPFSCATRFGTLHMKQPKTIGCTMSKRGIKFYSSDVSNLVLRAHGASPPLDNDVGTRLNSKHTRFDGNVFKVVALFMVTTFFLDSIKSVIKSLERVSRGFCINGYGSFWKRTHAVCFYVDILMTSSYLLASSMFKRNDLERGPVSTELEPLDYVFGSIREEVRKKKQDRMIRSVFTCGMVHMAISYLTREGARPIGILSAVTVLFVHLIASICCWFKILRGGKKWSPMMYVPFSRQY